MDILEKLKEADAFRKCEEAADVTWKACRKERGKPVYDPGCLHLKDFARTHCIGEFKDKIRLEYPLSSSHNTESGAGHS